MSHGPSTTSRIVRRLRRAGARASDGFVLRRFEELAQRARPDVADAMGRALLLAMEDDDAGRLADPVARAFGRLFLDEENPGLTETARTAAVDAFHRLYYHNPQRTWKDCFYRGTTIWKCPLDLWVYQELLYEVKPALVVETGTAFGGSARYLADLCDTLGLATRIVSIDVAPQEPLPRHERIRYVTASSTDEQVVAEVSASAPDGPVMVILDSDHTQGHVAAELQAWSPLVTTGSYLIVEDTNVNGHPALRSFGPGPMEAVVAFLEGRVDYVADPRWEKFYLTFNPRGYLKRVQ